MIALSKTLHPDDLLQLTYELRLVDEHFTTEAEQHPLRRWEYALALAAVKATKVRPAMVAYDIGGGGSPFGHMLADTIGANVQIVDPTYTPNAYTLAQLLHRNPRLGDVVTCLSVLEHVDELDEFCYHLSCLVAPGGLLFFTVDAWDEGDEDTAHFHWMRKRIFTAATLNAVARYFFKHDFRYCGDRDNTFHGAQVYDYTFASLALQKRA